MVAEAKRLLKIWWLMAKLSIQMHWTKPASGVLFIVGKLIRFVLFFVFLFSVLSQTETMAGYTREEVILFFLVFNLVDITIQFLFRGVYVFRQLVVSGNFDLELVRPYPSWFRPLFGQTDAFDLVTLIPLWGFFLWWVGNHYWLKPRTGLIFALAFVASLFLGFAIHLFICSVCVLTTKIDHLIWVYRDLTAMARFPTDIYSRSIRLILTFVVPVVLLITFPAKAILNLLSLKTAIFSFILALLFVFLSLKFWHYSLGKYTSASS